MSTNPRTACGVFSFAEGAGKNLFCKTRNPGHSAIFTKFKENCFLIHTFLLAVIAHRPWVCLNTFTSQWIGTFKFPCDH